VLGIVVTMASLGEGDQAAIGMHVGAALVGTFFGILAAYGFFGPLATSLAHDAKEEINLYESIKASLVASASGMCAAIIPGCITAETESNVGAGLPAMRQFQTPQRYLTHINANSRNPT
ncbi:MotA/TolQ/ExbB proton channel family protein, partial [Klebsiella pneumoniae]|uniref:MotA/TolQ/ExbB proton channel family protein n=1 Tax=Klebsiella pneumoniae TaxID=573 RepID=UPI00351D4299